MKKMEVATTKRFDGTKQYSVGNFYLREQPKIHKGKPLKVNGKAVLETKRVFLTEETFPHTKAGLNNAKTFINMNEEKKKKKCKK